MRDNIKIVNSKHFEVDLLTNFTIVSFGLTIGVNKFRGKRPNNIFIEIDFLFWCLGIEFKK